MSNEGSARAKVDGVRTNTGDLVDFEDALTCTQFQVNQVQYSYYY